MAKKDLTGKKVAILVEEGFEQVELIKPRKALDKVGAETKVVSPQQNEIRGWNIKRWGKYVPVDVDLDSANPEDFDALLLPGGVMNPDKLRMNEKAVAFVKHFIDAGKPVAARNAPDRCRRARFHHGTWVAAADAGEFRFHVEMMADARDGAKPAERFLQLHFRHHSSGSTGRTRWPIAHMT